MLASSFSCWRTFESVGGIAGARHRPGLRRAVKEEGQSVDTHSPPGPSSTSLTLLGPWWLMGVFPIHVTSLLYGWALTQMQLGKSDFICHEGAAAIY